MTKDSSAGVDHEEPDAPLVFIHLSDIHFTMASDGQFDVDADLRLALEYDVAHIRPDLPGPVAAVVVSGDIAFSGRDEEYKAAKGSAIP